MSDSAGERARLRRYPELPVWVVEDHQEVSGQPRSLGRRGQREPELVTCTSCIELGETPKLPWKLTWKNRHWRLWGPYSASGPWAVWLQIPESLTCTLIRASCPPASPAQACSVDGRLFVKNVDCHMWNRDNFRAISVIVCIVCTYIF